MTAGQSLRLVLTRNRNVSPTAYTGASAVFSLLDLGNLATIISDLDFFRDDCPVGSETGTGFVDYIQISDRALTAGQFAGLAGAVSGPASWEKVFCQVLARRRRDTPPECDNRYRLKGVLLAVIR